MSSTSIPTRLSMAERRDLFHDMKTLLPKLGALSSDTDFQYSELTGYMERLLHDWCDVVEAELTTTKTIVEQHEQSIAPRLVAKR